MAVRKSREIVLVLLFIHISKKVNLQKLKEWKVLILECERCLVSLDGILWYTKYLLVQK